MIRDIIKWRDRFQNIADVQKDLGLNEIQSNFTRREIIELIVIFNTFIELMKKG